MLNRNLWTIPSILCNMCHLNMCSKQTNMNCRHAWSTRVLCRHWCKIGLITVRLFMIWQGAYIWSVLI
jgi:hypothetical protein